MPELTQEMMSGTKAFILSKALDVMYHNNHLRDYVVSQLTNKLDTDKELETTLLYWASIMLCYSQTKSEYVLNKKRIKQFWTVKGAKIDDSNETFENIDSMIDEININLKTDYPFEYSSLKKSSVDVLDRVLNYHPLKAFPQVEKPVFELNGETLERVGFASTKK